MPMENLFFPPYQQQTFEADQTDSPSCSRVSEVLPVHAKRTELAPRGTLLSPRVSEVAPPPCSHPRDLGSLALRF